MSQNTKEILTGGVVIVAALAFFVYARQTTGLTSTSGGGYELTASFRSVEGVTVGTDVRLAGVKLGSVTSIDLNPETYRADTHFSIKEGVQIPDDSAVIVASEGLLGGNFVEVRPGGSLSNFEPGDEIEDTQGAVSLVSLLMKFVGSSGSSSSSSPPAPGPGPEQ